MEVGLGFLGMSEWEFYHTTPKAFYNKILGHSRVEQAINKRSWEQARFISYNVVTSAGKIAKEGTKPQDLMLFEWEKVKSLSKEEIENSRERFEYLKNKWHNQESHN